jgi:hypothetical protein
MANSALYTIQFRDWNDVFWIVCNFDDLYNVVSILEESKRVIEFKVTIGEVICFPKQDFGWDPSFKKWVSRFDWEKQKPHCSIRF